MQREIYLESIKEAFRTSPIVAILGPRQCGKTTLARQYFAANQGLPEHYFDLENPLDLERLQDPLLALEQLTGLIVIDEIQRLPGLFPVLRVLVDQQDYQKQFLILGSASRELIQQSSESLAGRIHYLELPPFSLEEVDSLEQLWIRGGFPRSYLAETNEDSFRWRQQYIKTYLEQDIPNLGIRIPAQQLRRFWMMLAHYHGQLMNYSELGKSLDLTQHNVKKYLDILTGTFMVRQLSPWHENISKRQVKAPKIYMRDSGILHTLLNIPDYSNLLTSPKIGASWEGFALESIMRFLKVDPQDCYFWATHAHAELDLLVFQGTQRLGYEFKFTKIPKLTKSMKIAAEDLKLDKLTVIYAGDKTIRLSANIDAIGLEKFMVKS
jgi:predicted AAA+ superfamily ATPase